MPIELNISAFSDTSSFTTQTDSSSDSEVSSEAAFWGPLSGPASPVLHPQGGLSHALSQWIASGPLTETLDRELAVRIVHSASSRGAGTPLNLVGMGLSSLPPMPATAWTVYARNNRVTSLPSSLPPDLSELDVRNNRIDHVPDSLRDSPYPTRIDLRGNFIPPHEAEDIQAQRSTPGYHGPRFDLDGQRTYDLAARRAAGLPAIGLPAGNLT